MIAIEDHSREKLKSLSYKLLSQTAELTERAVKLAQLINGVPVPALANEPPANREQLLVHSIQAQEHGVMQTVMEIEKLLRLEEI